MPIINFYLVFDNSLHYYRYSDNVSQDSNKAIYKYYLKGDREMSNIKEISKKLKNQYAKEWREKNPDKVKKTLDKYWEKKAREYLEKKEGDVKSEG